MSDKELNKCNNISSDCTVQSQDRSIECSPSEGVSTPPIRNLKSDGDECQDIVEKTPERITKKNRRHHFRSFSLQNVTSPFLTRKRMKTIENSRILNSSEGCENVSSFTPDKTQLQNVIDNNISPESTEDVFSSRGASVSRIIDPLKNVKNKSKKSLVEDKDFNQFSPNLSVLCNKKYSSVEPKYCSRKTVNENKSLVSIFSNEDILFEPEKSLSLESNTLHKSDPQNISKLNLNQRKLIYSTSSKLISQPINNILPENLLKDVLTLEQADTPCISENTNRNKFISISGNFVSVSKIGQLDNVENLNAEFAYKLPETQDSSALEETLNGYDFKLTQLENNYCYNKELHKTDMIKNCNVKNKGVEKTVVCRSVSDCKDRANVDNFLDFKSHPISTEGVKGAEIFYAPSAVSNIEFNNLKQEEKDIISNVTDGISHNKSKLISGMFEESSKITDLKISPQLKQRLGNRKTRSGLKESLNNSQSSYTKKKRRRNKSLSQNDIELPEQTCLTFNKTQDDKSLLSTSNTELKLSNSIKESSDVLSRDFLGFLNTDVNQSQHIYSKFKTVVKNKGFFTESDFVELSKERKLVNASFHLSANISSKSCSSDDNKNFNNPLSKIVQVPKAFIDTDFYDKLIITRNPESRLEASKNKTFHSSVFDCSFSNSNLKETLITTDDICKVDLKNESKASGSNFDDSFSLYDIKLTQIELYSRVKTSSKINSPFNLSKKRKLSLKNGTSNSSQSSLGDERSNSDFDSPIPTSSKSLINQSENDLKCQNSENISFKKLDVDLPLQFTSNPSCPNDVKNKKIKNEFFEQSNSKENLMVSENLKRSFADTENVIRNFKKITKECLDPNENIHNLREINNDYQSSEKLDNKKYNYNNKTVLSLPELKIKAVSNKNFADPSPPKKKVQMLGFTNEEMEVSEISVRCFYSFLKKLMVNDNFLIKNDYKNINSEDCLLDKTLECESFLESDVIMKNDNSIFNFSLMADEMSESQDMFSEPKVNEQMEFSFIESKSTTSPPLVTLSQKMKSAFDSFQGTYRIKSDSPISDKEIMINSQNLDKTIVSNKSPCVSPSGSEENPRRTAEKLIIEEHLNSANGNSDLKNSDNNSKGNMNPTIHVHLKIKEVQNLAIKDITSAFECNNFIASEDFKKDHKEFNETTNENNSTDLLNETFLMDSQLETISSNINNFESSSSTICRNVSDDIHNNYKFNVNETFKTNVESILHEYSKEIKSDVKDKFTSDGIRPIKSHQNLIKNCSHENYCKNLSVNIDIFNSEVEANSKQVTNYTANFSSASGRPILVTSESLRKIKNIFHEDHLDDCLEELNIQDQPLKPKTCETVGLPDQIRLYSNIGKSNCKNIHMHTKSISYNNCSTLAIEPDENKTLKIMESFGFSTASGKHAGTSRDALKDVKQLFCEEPFKENELFEDAKSIGNSKLPKSEILFNTPGEKYPSFSYKSFDESKRMFSELDSNSEQDQNTCIIDTKIIKNYSDVESVIRKKKDSADNLLITKEIENIEKFNTTISKFNVSCDLPTKCHLKRDDNAKKSQTFSTTCEPLPVLSVNISTQVSDKMSENLKEVQHSAYTEMPHVEIISKSNFGSIMKKEHLLDTFNTTSGKPVRVTSNNLAKVLKIFEEDFLNINLSCKEELERPEECQKNLSSIPFNRIYHSSEPNMREDEVIASSSNMLGNCNDLINKKVDKSTYLKTGLSSNEKPHCQLKMLHKSNNLAFTSGNGKFIEVSCETLSKVKQMFTDDIDFELSQKFSQDEEIFYEKSIENHLKTKKRPEELNFTPASGKAISVPSKSLFSVNTDFSISDGMSNEKEKVTLESKDNMLPKQNPVTGISFTSGTGKSTGVSTKSLANVSKLFRTIDTSPDITEDKKEETLELKDDKLLSLQKLGSRFSFTAGSGKDVSVSNKSLASVKQLFCDIDTSFDNTNKSDQREGTLKPKENNSLSQQSNGSKFSFTSGSGKSVGVSSKSLANVKKLFCDIDSPPDNIHDIEEAAVDSKNDKLMPQQKPLSRFSFTSGSGKYVSVSNKSLAGIKQLFGDIDTSFDNTNKSYQREGTLKPKENNSLSEQSNGSKFSFTSGSGKSVGVSSKSLANVKKLFCDIDSPPDNIHDIEEAAVDSKNDKLMPQQKPLSRFSFTSGSGKYVSVSNKSLAGIKQLFGDIDTSFDNTNKSYQREGTLKPKENNSLSEQSNGSKFSFTSGSGKSVSVSTKSLDRVKQLFGDFDTSPDNVHAIEEAALNSKHDNLMPQQKPLSRFSFTSGSGKDVGVSSNSLARVKQLFGDFDTPPDNIHGTEEAAVNSKNDNLMPQQKPLSGISFTSDDGVLSKSLGNAKQLFCVMEGNKVKFESKDDSNFNVKEGIYNESLCLIKVLGESTTKNQELTVKRDKENQSDNFVEPLNIIHTSEKELTQFNLANGFSSAGGKSIMISGESFVKISKLFEENNGNDQERKLLQTFESFNAPKEKNECVEYATLKEASSNYQINNNGISAQESLEIRGFNTINGKSMCVSENSLANFKNIFVDNNASNIMNRNNKNMLPIACNIQDELTSLPFSFNTASERSVAINEESLNKVKQLFDKNPSDKNTDGSEGQPCKNQMFNQNSFGFNTAGGKQVGISCENLSKEKALFNEVDDVNDCSKDKPEQILDIGFNSVAGNLCNENKEKASNIFGESNLLSSNTLNFKCFEKEVRFKHDANEVSEEITETSNADVKCKDIFSSDHCLSTPTGSKHKRIRALDLSGQSTESCQLKNSSAVSLESSFEYFGSQIDFSLAHEISESTAAFLADDDCNWTVQSPTESVIHPSFSKLKLLDSSTPLLTSTPEISSNRLCRKRLALNDSGFSPISKKLKSDIDERLEAFRKWREKALRRQEDIIKRKSGKEKPLTGILLSTREKHKPNKLNIVLKGEHPKTYTYQELIESGLDTNVIDVTSANAVDFNFDQKETFLECDKESKAATLDGLLVPNVDLKVGIAEVTQCFLTLPGVDPLLVPETWVANHYRWIVWKLASYEKSFPHKFAKRCLTVENLLIQLQYRHDREITLAQRPAIRKILEQDESPFRFIVLCIANTRKLDLEHQTDGIYELELTDGWYSIWAATDSEMTRLIQNSILKIGTKLVICGAQLVGTVGQPIDPLQGGAANGVRLKICTNSTRRAVWHCRLGFFTRTDNIPTSIGKVLPYGGQISQLTATLARVYPMLHMSKDPNGKNVFRSTKAESLEANSVERIRIEKAEKLYHKVFEEVEAKYKPKSSAGKRLTRQSLKNIPEITQPDVLYEMMAQSADPLYFQNQLSRDQVEILLDYRRQLMEKIQAEVGDTVKQRLEEMIPQRKVTTILKVRLIDTTNGENAMLTLWRPTDDLCSSMTENSVFCFNFITANGQRNKTLQLSTTRQTQYNRKDTTKGSLPFVRKLTSISEVDKPTFKPLFGEFDTIGFVFETKITPSGVNIVYLSDLEMNFLSITFWTSIKMFCKEEVFTSGSLIGACNVQWRLGSVSWQVPTSYATELSTFSNRPTQAHLLSLYSQYKQCFSSESDLKDFVEECKNKLVRLLAKRGSGGRPEHSQPSTPFSSSMGTPVTQLPGASHINTPSSVSIGTQSNHVNSPIICTPIQKRMKKLSSYGSPPPLTPLPINIAISHHSVTKDFKSPFRISENVLQDSQPSSSQSSSSPPLSLE